MGMKRAEREAYRSPVSHTRCDAEQCSRTLVTSGALPCGLRPSDSYRLNAVGVSLLRTADLSYRPVHASSTGVINCDRLVPKLLVSCNSGGHE